MTLVLCTTGVLTPFVGVDLAVRVVPEYLAFSASLGRSSTPDLGPTIWHGMAGVAVSGCGLLLCGIAKPLACAIADDEPDEPAG